MEAYRTDRPPFLCLLLGCIEFVRDPVTLFVSKTGIKTGIFLVVLSDTLSGRVNFPWAMSDMPKYSRLLMHPIRK
jgi:hypothetical protein